jgi:hypothetical protein
LSMKEAWWLEAVVKHILFQRGPNILTEFCCENADCTIFYAWQIAYISLFHTASISVNRGQCSYISCGIWQINLSRVSLHIFYFFLFLVPCFTQFDFLTLIIRGNWENVVFSIICLVRWSKCSNVTLNVWWGVTFFLNDDLVLHNSAYCHSQIWQNGMSLHT